MTAYATEAPATNLQAALEMASGPVEEAYILLAEAERIAHAEMVPLADILDRVGLLGPEEPTH